ncbi:MAG: winged helix-turn-helix domain-containing protein [Hyphomicrobiales bacterium]|nr:MAG: winged helix-turn-helix domain-containing protein [Hyphomicrobiales bacterium]
MSRTPFTIPLPLARRLWLNAQRLDQREPFGAGPEATKAAIEHLGYVQIDTINVIERSHHHILFSRIPGYRRADLTHAQSVGKSVFEYWTHALAYVPVRDFRFFVSTMKEHRSNPDRWTASVSEEDARRIVRRIRKDGPLSIRDVDTDVLIEKAHLWASKKPSKAALERAFYDGRLIISERAGMLKSYELTERHFAWSSLPKPATASQVVDYRLDRALRSQALISAPSVMHPWKTFPEEYRKLIDRRVRKKELVEIRVDDSPLHHWLPPELLDAPPGETEPLVHILSPFDPLVIQRARLNLFFGYDHIFEAYVPKAKRQFGYFTLPVLVGDEIVAALDLKTDRAAKKLLIQAWHWLPAGRPRAHKRLIEEELSRFERFQLGD